MGRRSIRGICPDCQAEGKTFSCGWDALRRCQKCYMAGYRARNPERVNAISRDHRDLVAYDGNRAAAIERDGYTCQHCFASDLTGKALHVHHIDGSGERRLRIDDHRRARVNNDLSNLLTLCAGCHRREHARMRREKQAVA